MRRELCPRRRQCNRPFQSHSGRRNCRRKMEYRVAFRSFNEFNSLLDGKKVASYLLLFVQDAAWI